MMSSVKTEQKSWSKLIFLCQLQERQVYLAIWKLFLTLNEVYNKMFCIIFVIYWNYSLLSKKSDVQYPVAYRMLFQFWRIFLIIQQKGV